MKGKLERDGAVIVYETRGAGPAIILAHNILCDRRVFDEVIGLLGDAYRTISVDLRGQGESSVPARAYSVSDLAGDLAAVLDAEKIDKAVVVGLSLGATTALELTLSRPERVAALVLMGATAREDDFLTSVRNAFLSPLVRAFGVRGPILQKAVTSLFGASYRAEGSPDFAEWTRRINELPSRSAYFSLRAWRLRGRFLERLGQVRAPTLIVAGEEDVACTVPEARELQRGIRGSALALIPRAGHTMSAERPQAVAAALRSFIDPLLLQP